MHRTLDAIIQLYMTGHAHSHTFRLFRQGGSPFLEGMASIFDMADNSRLYHYDRTDAEADLKSLRADWLQVGQDLSDAMREYAARQNA